MSQSIIIKNMVCDRCITAVTTLFEQLQIHPLSVTLGKVDVADRLTSEQELVLKEELKRIGFEWVVTKNEQLVEQIKSSIIELIHHQSTILKVNLSDHLSQLLGIDYSQLSKLFSESEATTIEKFVIQQKIERVKELMSYKELSLSEIADLMNYSSVAHLSSQFKKNVGITPTEYMKQAEFKRINLDEI